MATPSSLSLVPSDVIIYICYFLESASDVISYSSCSKRFHNLLLGNSRHLQQLIDLHTKKYVLYSYSKEPSFYDAVTISLSTSKVLPNGNVHGEWIRYLLRHRHQSTLIPKISDILGESQCSELSVTDSSQQEKLLALFIPNAVISEQGRMEFNKRQGKWIKYAWYRDTDGHPQHSSEGEYEDNLEHGDWADYDINHHKFSINRYDKGEEYESIELDQHQHITSRSRYRAGTLMHHEKYIRIQGDEPSSAPRYLQQRFQRIDSDFVLELWHENGVRSRCETRCKRNSSTQRFSQTWRDNGLPIKDWSPTLRLEYWEDGTLKEKILYEDDHAEGLFESYDESGRLSRRGINNKGNKSKSRNLMQRVNAPITSSTTILTTRRKSPRSSSGNLWWSIDDHEGGNRLAQS